MQMEEKLVINELEQGKELTKRLMNNLKNTSSIESSKALISEILRIYQNAIFMLSFNEEEEEDKNKNSLKRKHDMDTKKISKKRKISSEKKTEKVSVYVGSGQEKGLIDDGYCWRKYGQKEIHGSTNPRGYFRCTHRYSQNCLAVKQVQRSDKDPSIYEVKYVGNHTCTDASTTKTTSFSLSLSEDVKNRVHVTEQYEDIKPKITEEVRISLDDLENKKNIFDTFSLYNHEIEDVGGWESNIFSENLSPSTSGSGITNEIVSAPTAAVVDNSETADSFYSSLDNIVDFGQDWLWSLV